MRFNSIPILLLAAAGISAQSAPSRPIVPDLNGRSVTLVTPDFSDASAAFAADGSTLVVNVVVDPSGTPMSAVCSPTCHPAMKQAAENAAMESRFAPLIVRGRSIEYEGKLIYTIAIKTIDWFQFGTFMRSVLNFDNISVAPAAQILTSEFGLERARLSEIDNERDVNERIRKIAAEITHFRKRLAGRNLWLFNVGLATRNVTFWVLAGERINRKELRDALAQVGQVAETAPAEITKEFVEALREFSKFEFVDEMPERDLRQAISKLAGALRGYPR